MLLIHLHLALLHFFHFVQDTTQVNPEPSSHPTWTGYLIGYVASNIVPLVVAWIVQKWVNIRDTWYAQQNDIVKRLVYTGVTTLAMLVVQALGVGWDATADLPTVISKIILALMSTFLVKVGIETEMARSTRSKTRSRRKT